MEVVGGDGKVRRIHPILACYMADYHTLGYLQEALDSFHQNKAV
jgi:hypothetical protein